MHVNQIGLDQFLGLNKAIKKAQSQLPRSFWFFSVFIHKDNGDDWVHESKLVIILLQKCWVYLNSHIIK